MLPLSIKFSMKKFMKARQVLQARVAGYLLASMPRVRKGLRGRNAIPSFPVDLRLLIHEACLGDVDGTYGRPGFCERRHQFRVWWNKKRSCILECTNLLHVRHQVCSEFLPTYFCHILKILEGTRVARPEVLHGISHILKPLRSYETRPPRVPGAARLRRHH